MIRMLSCATAATLLLVLSNTAWSQQNVFDRLEREAAGSEGAYMTVILGAGLGYFYANSELVDVRKVRPLYCQPAKLTLNAQNYTRIALNEYKRNPSYYLGMVSGNHAQDALAWALLHGLQAAFPCQ